MGIHSGIQLRGREQVIQAFRNCDVEAWAIFQWKDLLTKGIGEEMLTKFLDLIAENASNAVYRLKAYEDIKDAKEIKEKTEASCSLSFKLNDEDYEQSGSGIYERNKGYSNRRNDLDQRLKSIEEKLDNRNEEPQTIGGALIGLLNSPAEIVELLTAIAHLKNGTIPPAPAPQIPAANYAGYNRGSALGNVNQNTTMNQPQTQEQLLKRLQNAVTILEEKDPHLVDHLERLAIIAQDKPAQFQVLLSMLDKM